MKDLGQRREDRKIREEGKKASVRKISQVDLHLWQESQ